MRDQASPVSPALDVSVGGGGTVTTGVYTGVLVDRGGVLATELHTDAIGAKVVPASGVETGFGGTQRSGGAGPGTALLVTAARGRGHAGRPGPAAAQGAARSHGPGLRRR